MYTVKKAKKEIKTAIRAYLLKDAEGKFILDEVNRLPLYLVGAPGIGKTQLTEQVAEELGIGFVSFSITHHTRNTVLGLPLIDTVEKEEGVEKYTRYTMSEIIAAVEQAKADGHDEGILLIDEFACMAESLVAPMLAFLQTKNIGAHTLPEGWVLVLCSNPPQYNKTARRFDMAVMDRVRVMEITFDRDEFLQYGQEKGFHPVVLEYIRNHKSDVHVCTLGKDGTTTIVTTRGWENLSHCLKGYESVGGEVTEELIRQFIKSDSIAYEFYKFYIICNSCIKPEQARDILNGVNHEQYIELAKDLEYEKHWNLINLLSRLLDENARECMEEETFLDYLEKFKKEMKRVVKGRDDFGESISVIQTLERRLGKGNIFASVELKAWEERKLDDRERDCLMELLMAMEKLGLERDVDESPFVNDSGRLETQNEKYFKILEETIKNRKKALAKEQEKVSSQIQNALSFVKSIEKNNGLMSPFMSLINQKKSILSVLCKKPSKLYVEQVKKIYGVDSMESLEKRLEEVS